MLEFPYKTGELQAASGSASSHRSINRNVCAINTCDLYKNGASLQQIIRIQYNWDREFPSLERVQYMNEGCWIKTMGGGGGNGMEKLYYCKRKNENIVDLHEPSHLDFHLFLTTAGKSTGLIMDAAIDADKLWRICAIMEFCRDKDCCYRETPLHIGCTVNVHKFWTLITCQKGLDKQFRPRSDCSEKAVWSGSSLFAFQKSILWIQTMITNILFENPKRKVFQILEHLPYLKVYLYADDFNPWPIVPK